MKVIWDPKIAKNIKTAAIGGYELNQAYLYYTLQKCKRMQPLVPEPSPKSINVLENVDCFNKSVDTTKINEIIVN